MDIHWLGEGGFETMLVPDPVLPSMFFEGTAVNRFHPWPTDKNGFGHCASLWSNFFRSAKILSVNFSAVRSSRCRTFAASAFAAAGAGEVFFPAFAAV